MTTVGDATHSQDEFVRMYGSCVKKLSTLALISFQDRQRQLEGVGDECSLTCKIKPILVELDDPAESQTLFECLTNIEDDEQDPDFHYSIDLPEDFVVEHLRELLPGYATVCVPGGTLVRSVNRTDLDVVHIPEISDIRLIQTGQTLNPDTELLLSVTSPRRVLVVRVLGDSGAEAPNESQDSLAGAIFGIRNQALSNSMRAQYNSCSFGQLDLEPSNSHSLISNGVLDVTLDFKLARKHIVSIDKAARREVRRLLGLPRLNERFEHVMFCVPPQVDGSWTARADIGGYRSYFRSGRCDKLSALMHEIGHNLGLTHSGQRGEEYGDTTGVVSERVDAYLVAHVLTFWHSVDGFKVGRRR